MPFSRSKQGGDEEEEDRVNGEGDERARGAPRPKTERGNKIWASERDVLKNP